MKTYPLTQTQLGIYLAEVSATGNANYNIDMLYHLDEHINIERLQSALEAVINNHPYVKSILIQNNEGELLMEDHSDDAPVVEILEEESIETIRKEIDEKHDLQRQPLYRLVIYKTKTENLFFMHFHHIIFDGSSFYIFQKELNDAYAGNALIPEKEDGFSIALEEKELRISERYNEEKAWYEQEFAAASEIESAPIKDVFDAKEGEWLFAHHPLKSKKNEVKALCEKHGIGISIPFTAAFGYTLANFTGNEESMYATVFFGRNDQHTDKTFDMLVKTMPVYHDFRKTPSVTELLQQTSTQIRECRNRTIYSFTDVKKDLGLEPKVCLAYQGVLHSLNLVLDGRTQVSEDLIKHAPGFDIYIHIIQKEEAFECMVEYNTSMYSAEFIEQFCSSYSKVLDEIIHKEMLADIEIADEKQVEQLDAFNVYDYENTNKNETIVSLFRKTAAKYPDNIAVVFKEKKITYRELDEITDRIASNINAKVVSIIIGRNENMPICALAALKAGAAYQPLDPSYPQERLNFMVKDSNAELLIADRELRELLNEYEGEVLYTDELDALQSKEIKADNGLNGASPFILLYTSGSTGVPKGVVLEHGNLVSFCGFYCQYYDLQPCHKVAAYASFGFDANMMDTYPALVTGASVVIIPEEIRLDLYAISDYLEKNSVTHAFFTTQVGQQFVTAFPEHKTLMHVSMGGEKMASMEPPVNYKMHNIYGPTECTVFVTIKEIDHKEPNIPIGPSNATAPCYIVNKHGKRMPAGAAGELIVTGGQVGRGYLNREEKTAEVFRDFEHPRMGKVRSYRTGDIVRYRENGDIEFVGRKDGQVKIRGFRIELKEVEAVIRDFQGIKDATVQAFDLESGGKYIAAYIVSDEKIDIEALNDFIISQKPPYMVPAVTMQIDAIPLNVNQKVDKKKLPKAEVAVSDADASETEAPRELNILEQQLVEMAEGLIGNKPPVSVPLSYCGLSSILSMRLAAQLFKKFGIKMTSKELTTSASIQTIENVILTNLLMGAQNTKSGANNEGNNPSLLSQKKEEEVLHEAPITFSQQGVYIDCQMNPDSTMYNLPMSLVFPASVKVDTLIQSVKKVAEAHPALFCNFIQTEDDVMMRMSGDNTLDIEVKNLDAEAFEEEKNSFTRPFDLEKDTLIRAEVVVMSDNRKVLLVDMHHIVSDGSSYNIFINELINAVNGQDIEKETCDYLHFAAEQKAKAEQGGLEENKTFFDNMFAKYESAANVPVNKTSNEKGSLQHASTPISPKLLDIKLPEGITHAHFWFAAFNYALSRYANTKDVFTSFISSGRQNLEIADTIGMFINTMPCAVHVKDQTVEEFIKEVSQSFTDVVEHENYPFARIAADYDFKGSASFAYQLGVISKFFVEGESVEQELLSLTKAKMALVIFIQNVDGVPCVDAEYDDSKYTHDLIARFTESIVAVAEHFAEDMSAKLKQVSIMSERQKQEVESMHLFSKEDIAIKTMHEGFEQWAEKTPDAMAIVTSERCLTYAEYNAEANQLARALQAHGMKQGDRIVLLLPRRSYYLTALFAVQKCGGAYIPMDPEYPADRIAYILDDSAGRFVLTTDDKLADYPGRALSIRELMDEAKALPADNLNLNVSPHDLAYVIYTSGSTGRPKGVMLEHLSVSNFFSHWAKACPGIDTTQHVAISQSTVSFDYSIFEYGMQLFKGGTVAFANEEETKNPMEMVKFCKRFGVSIMNGTPSRVAINMEIDDFKEMMISQVKMLFVGGEKLPWSLVEDSRKMGIALINGYGPTETTMGSSFAVMNDANLVHVGKPIPNNTYQILDNDLNELPVGVMGELCIGGFGLARGYNNMPERTAESFIQWNDMRIYRTGDYAMWTSDGNMMIMGRTDNQVKLNGLRIELGEIETVMKQQPGISHCVASIMKIGSIDKLIGYYTTTEAVEEDKFEEEMRQMMGEHLTPYMVPGIFMHLDELPLTPAGKTDIKRLPVPEVQTGEYIAPANDIEKVLCEAYATTLNIKKVGATDDFFEMGGTSLVAMRLIGIAIKANLNVVYKDIFENPTPRKLAMKLHPELYSSDMTNDKELYPYQHEVEEYDYSQLEDILQQNNLQTFLNGKMHDRIGNVFLAGATGYLGIHILYNLINRNDTPHIYCMVRGSKNISAESRLRTLLFYYFSNSYNELFDNGRITVVEGDVTNAEVFDNFDKEIDLVINCAANVKHFSAGTDIEDINIGGCVNCINLCLRTGARFIQTSTGSVTGSTVSDEPAQQHYLTEQELYFGQALFTKYESSKFLAERNVLDAVKNKGLKAKIVRLGNLCARSTDGEFQINFRSNSFMGSLKAYQVLGCVPYSMECGFSEFSPIDNVADAIIRLALTPDEMTVFHPVNIHCPPFGDVIECMNKLGIEVDRVEDNVFADRLAAASDDPNKSTIVQSLMGYDTIVPGKHVIANAFDVKSHTAQILLRLGFRWSFTTWDYMEAYLRGLIGLGVFDNDYER